MTTSAPGQPKAEIACRLCAARATFVGPSAFADMIAWDKSHHAQCVSSPSATAPVEPASSLPDPKGQEPA